MRFKCILLPAIGFFIAGQLAAAQTWTQTSAPITNWQRVASSADGTKLVALTLNQIYRSTNSGTTWQKATNSPLVSSSGWSSLAGSADGSTWMASVYGVPTYSGNGGIFISTNFGLNWVRTNAIETLLGVACSADATKMFAVDGGSLWTSTNSGATWQQTNLIPIIYFGVVNSISSSADRTRLVIGASNSGVYVSTNQGATWSRTSVPNRVIYHAACSADGNTLAVMSPDRWIYISTNSGATWRTNTLPAASWISGACSLDGTKMVVAATNGPIYFSTNAGISWYSNSVPSNNWSAVAMSADGTKLTAASASGGIFTSYVPPQPSLNLAISNNSLVLSWPVSSTNFALQQISDVTQANWLTLANTPALNFTNLRYQVTLPLTNGIGFYRLKTP
jgi:hypothetical protein